MILITIDIPVCFSDECKFIGVKELLLRNTVPAIALVLITLGAIFYFRFNYRIDGEKKLSSRITQIEDMNYEHLTFLTTYIIPLICFNLSSTRYLLALAILLIVIGIIYVKTDKFYANPTLAVLGFRLYKVTLKTRLDTKENVILITRDRLFISDQVRVLSLDEKVYFSRKTK